MHLSLPPHSNEKRCHNHEVEIACVLHLPPSTHCTDTLKPLWRITAVGLRTCEAGTTLALLFLASGVTTERVARRAKRRPTGGAPRKPVVSCCAGLRFQAKGLMGVTMWFLLFRFCGSYSTSARVATSQTTTCCLESGPNAPLRSLPHLCTMRKPL